MPDFRLIGRMLPELFQKTENWRQIYMQRSSTFLYISDCKLFGKTRFFINLLGFMPMRAHTE